MRPFYCVIFLLSFLISCKSGQPLPHKDNWYAFTKQSSRSSPEKTFEIKDDLIRMHGSSPGYIMSGKSYKNFRLTVQYRWNIDEQYNKGKKGLRNSGVMYHVQLQKDTLWPKGIQFQIKEGSTGDFILIDQVSMLVRGEQIAPGKSVNVSKLQDTENAMGEWNSIEIVVKDGKYEQFLNGKLVNMGEQASVTEGHILLQYEGWPIDFKDLAIKKL